ncbi:Hypothetical protein LUCI_0710 [Lucifera butyrica]|uniref:Uncharacterized protein n=1 Tax=Lucifera butyrica TaxID=1351585 RepID=A0A498R3W6_9FIRM|nr:hypothetical protein [Lucifera butyrica]VBB05500.1 Hypothetical protein LUCI_0710 [Lucifera butyrica]
MSLNTIDIIGQLADLKDTDYKNTLAISVLIELLVEKGFFTRQDFALKARELEQSTLSEILLARRMTR